MDPGISYVFSWEEIHSMRWIIRYEDYSDTVCFLLFLAFSSTGWYFTDLLPPILFRRAKKVCDSLLAAPVGVSWTSDSSNTLSSSEIEKKVERSWEN